MLKSNNKLTKTMKLNLEFSTKAGVKAADTFLNNQNAPYRVASLSPTKGVDVNTGEVVDTNEETFVIQLPTEYWVKRAERELKTLFDNQGNLGTFSRV